MKLQFTIAVVLLTACCLANAYDGDGQPGCKTLEELNIAIFRDNWDATSFWKCEVLNEPATKMRCPDQMGFMDSLKDCVVWDDWTWEQPIAPPSEVDEEINK